METCFMKTKLTRRQRASSILLHCLPKLLQNRPTWIPAIKLVQQLDCFFFPGIMSCSSSGRKKWHKKDQCSDKQCWNDSFCVLEWVMLIAYPPICTADGWSIMRAAKTKRWGALHACIIAPTLKGTSLIRYLQLVPPTSWHRLSCWWRSGARGCGPCSHRTQAADEPSAHNNSRTRTWTHRATSICIGF